MHQMAMGLTDHISAEGASEEEFLAAYDASRFPRPSVAVDLVLMTVQERRLMAFVLKRNTHPDRGMWSLPGGFVGIDESLDAAAERVLRTKAGLSETFIEQLYSFGEPARDPRTRVISVAYFALVPAPRIQTAVESTGRDDMLLAEVRVRVGTSATDAELFGENGERLAAAFDHARILGVAVGRLRGRLNYSAIGYELLPEEFTLRDLRVVHETILGRALNKDAFRRRMLASGDLRATGRLESSVGHRPAELYRFESEKP
jgi:8-oxo-dGTP diphosphatase